MGGKLEVEVSNRLGAVMALVRREAEEPSFESGSAPRGPERRPAPLRRAWSRPASR